MKISTLVVVVTFTAIVQGSDNLNFVSAPSCIDYKGQKRDLLEEWQDDTEMCLCDFPEKYLADPPPFDEFSPPEPLCRKIGCVDRYTMKLKAEGETMFNEAYGVTCTCVPGRDPTIMDQGLDDLYHWQC